MVLTTTLAETPTLVVLSFRKWHKKVRLGQQKFVSPTNNRCRSISQLKMLICNRLVRERGITCLNEPPIPVCCRIFPEHWLHEETPGFSQSRHTEWFWHAYPNLRGFMRSHLHMRRNWHKLAQARGCCPLGEAAVSLWIYSWLGESEAWGRLTGLIVINHLSRWLFHSLISGRAEENEI